MPVTIYSAKDNAPIDVCGLPGVCVLVTVPAAFSGTCTSACVPDVLENLDDIKKAGADRVIVVTTDQPFAINEWVKIAKFENKHITFASDFGRFELRNMIGKLSDEEGKHDLPPLLGELLRRSYSVIKDGKVVWQFIEPDTTKYSLNIQDLIDELKKAKRA